MLVPQLPDLIMRLKTKTFLTPQQHHTTPRGARIRMRNPLAG